MSFTTLSRVLLRQSTSFTPFIQKPLQCLATVPSRSTRPLVSNFSTLSARTRPMLSSSVRLSTLPTKVTVPPYYICGAQNFDHLHKKQHPAIGQCVKGMSTPPGCPHQSNKSLVDMIKDDLKHLNCTPFPALALGCAGLLPMWFPTLAIMTSGIFYTSSAFSQVAYGACVLSFLGGIRWGYVIPDKSIHKPDWLHLGWSVAPPILAWMALLMPISFCQLTLMGGMAGAAYMDCAMKCYPPWFRALRFSLTCGALIPLFLSFMFGFMFRCCENRRCKF